MSHNEDFGLYPKTIWVWCQAEKWSDPNYVFKRSKNRQSQKKNEKLRKNICNSYHTQRLISLIYKELLQINKRINNPVQNWAKEQIFSGREIEIALQHMRKCSTSLIFSPIRSPKMKRYEETHWRGCEKTGMFIGTFSPRQAICNLLKITMYSVAQGHRHKVIPMQQCYRTTWLCSTLHSKRLRCP